MLMPIEIPTLAGTMRELAGRGFTEHFIMVNETLRGVDSKTMFSADEVTVAEYHRFEGASDPDDMAILYAVQTRSGARGRSPTRSASTRTRESVTSCARSWLIRAARPRGCRAARYIEYSNCGIALRASLVAPGSTSFPC